MRTNKRRTNKRRTNKRRTNKYRKTRRMRLKQRGGSGDIDELIQLCMDNNLEGAQRYLRENPEIDVINYAYKMEMLFIHTCSYGRLEMAQWLYQISPKFNNKVYERTFRYACSEGHLSMAQWLLQINPNINNREYTKSFLYACSNGQLDVAKWLLEVSKERGQDIDISSNDNEVFLWTCQKKHLDVAKWLTTLNPAYEIENEDSPDWTCKVLTDPKDIKWKRRKPVTWLASNEAEDNILKRLPTDVAKITGSYL